MTQTTQAIELTDDAVQALSRRHEEPEWLLRQRLEAWRRFEVTPMPDALSEEWKRTDPARLSLEGLTFDAPAAAIESATGLPAELRSLWEEREEVAGRVVQLDSDVVYQRLDERLADSGVILSDLHRAAGQHEAILGEHLFSRVSPAEWKYLALHGALWSGGCLVYVPAGVEVELPVEYALGLRTPGLAVFPHLLIVAEANSSITVIQESASPALAEVNVVSGAVEVVAREGARVRLVDVQRWGPGVQHFSTARVALARDASFQAIHVGLGAALTKTRLDVLLEHEGSSAELLGLFMGDADQHFDCDTRQDHVAPRTQSDLLFKSALAGSASFGWNGVVDVRQSASHASANQTSRNLLLSPHASASPTPILEISAFDVEKCSHGATVGPVDQEQIFYLQSRGIPAEEAERMLVEGFFAEVLERVPSEGLRGRVQAVLAAKLGW